MSRRVLLLDLPKAEHQLTADDLVDHQSVPTLLVGRPGQLRHMHELAAIVRSDTLADQTVPEELADETLHQVGRPRGAGQTEGVLHERLDAPAHRGGVRRTAGSP